MHSKLNGTLVLVFAFLLALILAGSICGQILPAKVKKYLDRNFHGWKLAGECYEQDNKRVISGDFDGNGKRDYAMKFVRGDKGFFMAFIQKGRGYKPFYLHLYTADDAKFSDLMLFNKGDDYELGESNFKLKHDAPADFRCESDVGGVHVYRNGKFIAH